MDTNGSQGTWIGDGYADTRNDFVTATANSKYRQRFRDPPHPVKSRDAIFLTEAEKQLEETESKYVSTMERLQYLKLLYDSAGSMSLAGNDHNRSDESPITERNSQSDGSLTLNLGDESNCENNLTSVESQYPRDLKNVKWLTQEETEPAEQSPAFEATSVETTLRPNIFHNVPDENSNDWDGQNYFSESAEGGRTNFLHNDSPGNSVTDNAHCIREEHLVPDASTRIQHPYQLQLAEYSKSIHDEFEKESQNDEPSNIRNQDAHLEALISSRRQNSTEPVLHLNLSESVETLQTSMRNKKSRNSKHRKVSKIVQSKSIEDEAGPISKRKRKKRGVTTSNSRCTTATKDTSISEYKKDTRTQKQRGHSTISRRQASQNRRQDVTTKSENNKSEVVEIYHNSAVKSGSLSVVSSKHSKVMDSRVRCFNANNKLDQPWRTKKSYRLVANDDQIERVCDDIAEQKSKKQDNEESNRSAEIRENENETCQDDLLEPTDCRSGEPNTANYQSEYPVDEGEAKMTKQYGDHRHRNNCQSSQNYSSPCYDVVSARNYELPTVSSRLKQVHRSYFNRFNFRHIPFVVGTSITPSYNLGLNIQEALSLMKTRQGLSNGVPPLIISSVTKGIRPISKLLESMPRENEIKQLTESNIPYNVNSCGIASVHPPALTEEKISRFVPLGAFHLKTSALSIIPDTETLSEARRCANSKIEVTAKIQNTRSICSSIKGNLQKSVDSKPALTQSTLLRQRQDELNSGDTEPTRWQNVNQSSKGIREVLMNFHDQYEAMISKFEKLQDQSKKTRDKSLDKEIAALEKELNAKEEEINAVASLYQEVMILKQQMRMLHERNSLVCVATESPRSPTSPHFTIRAQTANPIRMINFYRRGGSFSNQGPPTSTKLAGLLRQIKTFQKQLKSTT